MLGPGNIERFILSTSIGDPMDFDIWYFQGRGQRGYLKASTDTICNYPAFKAIPCIDIIAEFEYTTNFIAGVVK
jgi:hypothetical protein